MATAAILAGGQATRFGGMDKGALVVGTRSILERQLRELAQISDDILLVGSRHVSMNAVGFRLVADQRPGCGPLGGLETALAEARDEVVVLVAGDMPFVTASLLQYLQELAETAQAVVPRTERGYHPLCAAYARSCRVAVAKRLAARQFSMMGLLEDLKVRAVEPNEIERFGAPDRLLANVNTPAQFYAIEALDHNL
jgi:molybdopterin-guanine dinucleotide biosynthesis protein A